MISREELGNLIDAGKNTKECCDILKISIRKLKELRKEYGFNRVYLNFKTNCGFCGKSHEYVALKEKEIYFCNIKCSVSVRKKSDETKNKISNKLKEYFSDKKLDKFCLECNINIKNKRRRAKFCSKKCSSKYLYKSDDVRKVLSEKRIKHLENSKHINWIDTYNINNELIKVQGNWEKEFALSCNRLGVLYERKSVKFTNSSRYTPDFYLPEYNFFVEIKGFLYEKDKYKMLVAVNNTNLDLRMISDIKKIKSISLQDLIELDRVVDLVKMDDVDFSKFVKRY